MVGPGLPILGTVTTLQELAEIEAIKRLKYAYLRCLDQKRWDEIGELFLPDATVTYSGGKYHYEGRERIVEFLRTNMGSPSFHSSHRVHHPEIELVSPTRATGVWAMEDTNLDPDLDFHLVGAGFYEDVYDRSQGRWLIAHTGYRRTFELVAPLSATKATLTASWWSTGGRSSLEVI